MFTISKNTRQYVSGIWFDLTDPDVIDRIKEHKMHRIATYAEKYFRQDKLISLIKEKRESDVLNVFPSIAVSERIYLSLSYSDFTDNDFFLGGLSTACYQTMKETVQIFLDDVFPGKTIVVEFNQDPRKGLEITITW